MKYLWVVVILGLSFNAFAAGKNQKKRTVSGTSASGNRVYENVKHITPAQVEAEVITEKPKKP